MPSSTTNYNLNTYDRVSDANEAFIDYRDDMGGTSASSNMVKIDAQMKVNADTISNVAGVGRTTETVIDNANGISANTGLITATNTTIAQNITPSIKYYDTTGTNSYTVTTDGTFQLVNGTPLNLNFVNPNTGDSTVNVDGNGIVNILRYPSLEQVSPYELDGHITLVYNTASSAFLFISNIDTRINDSYNLDLQEAYGYVKDVIPFEQLEDTGITLTGGAYGTTGLKIGADTYGADNVGVNKVFTASFASKDLTKLNNGLVSSTDDYITLPITVTGTLPTAIRMELSANVGAIDVNDFNQDLIPILNFQVLKFKKSLFTQTGSPNWNDIGYLRITAVGGDATTDIWMDKTQLVKSDPSGLYPNPIPDFEIIDGEWVVVKEFNEIQLIQLESNLTSATNALKSRKTYDNCIIYGILESPGGNDCDALNLYIDDDNRITFDVLDDELRIIVEEGGVSTIKKTDMDITAFEFITFEAVKNGSDLYLTAYIEGDKNNPYYVSHTTTLNGLNFTVGTRTLSNVQRYRALSITEISHAHHSNYAERAGGLDEQAKCKLSMSSNQSIPDGVPTKIALDNAITDNREQFEVSFNRCIIRESGYHDILGKIRYELNASGVRRIYIYINGTAFNWKSYNPVSATDGTDTELLLKDIWLNKGDYVELYGLQNTGGALNVLFVDNSKDYTSLTVSKS